MGKGELRVGDLPVSPLPLRRAGDAPEMRQRESHEQLNLWYKFENRGREEGNQDWTPYVLIALHTPLYAAGQACLRQLRSC